MNQGQKANAGSARPDRIRFRLSGVTHPYDTRTNAIRPDLADLALAETHFAPHYAAAVPLVCVADQAFLYGEPDARQSATSELLFGESFHVLDVRADWAWGYSSHDHYVGYLRRDALGLPTAPTHRTRHVAPVFTAADIKSPVVRVFPIGSLVAGTPGESFLDVAGGHIHSRHVVPISQHEEDWVAVAERYLGQPYIWGGRGNRGVDCSGLVQMALGACGIPCPRDSDQQAAALGAPIPDGEALRRGDLVFFPGHVGMMADETRLLHANAHWMSTVIEPLADVVARLSASHDTPITARRRIMP